MKVTSGGGEPLGSWCARVRRSAKKMKNNEKPIVIGLSKDNSKRLNDIGFHCWTENKRENGSTFEKRFEDLKAHKAKHGHCDAKERSGEYRSLGGWCSKVRQSIDKIKNHRKPLIVGLPEDKIKRLNDIGFDWKLYNRAKRT